MQTRLENVLQIGVETSQMIWFVPFTKLDEGPSVNGSKAYLNC